MKNIIFHLLSLICCLPSMMAQSTRQQNIEEAELGWVKIYHFTGAKETKQMDNRLFSIAQISICDSFANWMQASYIPKGGIGDIRKAVFPKLNQYSPYNAALPQGYSATAYTWSVNYNSQGKWERIPETETPWTIAANSVPGWPVAWLSSVTRYYFTMPSFEVSGEAVKREQDLSGVVNLKPYISFWIKNIEAGNGTEYVLLSKNNQSPFIKLTKGEYLDLLETALPRVYQEEKKSIYEKNSGNQKSIDYFMKYLDDKNTRRMSCLKNTREKYKDRLNETAEIFTAQPDFMLETYPDVFEGNGGGINKFPVYTIDPTMYELCKKDKPQWILVSWYWNPGSPKEKHMHESIIHNFNFDYVYNFFFDPGKVKGQPYKPMISPSLKEATTVSAISETGRKAPLYGNIHFFEDFSTTAAGGKPNGWYTRANNPGVSSTVTLVDGSPGNWALIQGSYLVPRNLKRPLPQNFTLTYDVIVPEHFTWGAKGLVFILAKEKAEGVNEAFILIKIRPGADGADGQGELETLFPSGYASGTKYYEMKGFSNNKTINRIQVAIKKNGEALQLSIDGVVTIDYPKAMPADILFNALSFEMGRSDGDTEKYYISNIKVTKD